MLRTRKQVQLRAYRENGLTQWKEPPRDLLILRRSGFVLPEPAATRSKPATARPEPAAAPSELPAVPQAQILASATPGSASRVETVTVAESVPAAAAETATALQPPDLPPLEPVPPPSSTRKDPQLQLAQFERKDPVVTQVPGTGQAMPDAPGRRRQPPRHPPTEPSFPVCDLPPIEGANEKEVEVPNLTNPEDVPRSQPLPGPGDQPAAPIRRAEPGRGKNQEPPLPLRPPRPRSCRGRNASPASSRAAAASPMSRFFPSSPMEHAS